MPDMPVTERTEAMIALRAAKTAVRVSRDVAYPHLDVPPDMTTYVELPACDWEPPEALYYIHPAWAVASPTSEDLPSPMWLNVLLSLCIIGVGVAVVVAVGRF